jgi:hypothetical protein
LFVNFLKSTQRAHPSQTTWNAEELRSGFKRVVSNLLKTDIKSLKTELTSTEENASNLYKNLFLPIVFDTVGPYQVGWKWLK